MDQILDFDAFEQDFRDACVEGIRFLSRNYNQAPFYAVCIYMDGFDGCFGLYANREEDFVRTLQNYRSKYPECYGTVMQVKELRYSSGDWEFQSVGLPGLDLPDDFECVSVRMEGWSRKVHALSYEQEAFTEMHYQLFEEVACRIALSTELARELTTLQKSDDFLITVSGHDEPSLASIYRPMWYSEKGSLDGFDAYAYSVEHPESE